MKIKTKQTDRVGLEYLINSIGYDNILHILPEHRYDGTLFIIVYKENDNADKN